MAPNVPDRPETAARARVLLIDDDAAICRIVGRMLRERYDITVLNSARDALDRITRGEQYDAILCDLMMPDLTGMDLYDALRRQAPGMTRRVLFLTGGAFTARAAEFFRSVDNPRLEKPFDRTSLLAALGKLLKG